MGFARGPGHPLAPHASSRFDPMRCSAATGAWPQTDTQPQQAWTWTVDSHAPHWRAASCPQASETPSRCSCRSESLQRRSEQADPWLSQLIGRAPLRLCVESAGGWGSQHSRRQQSHARPCGGDDARPRAPAPSPQFGGSLSKLPRYWWAVGSQRAAGLVCAGPPGARRKGWACCWRRRSRGLPASQPPAAGHASAWREGRAMSTATAIRHASARSKPLCAAHQAEP